MNLGEIIKKLQEYAKYDTPERYEVQVKATWDGSFHTIVEVDDDEDGIFILIED